MKNILLIQDRLMNIEDQSTGIHEEIHFWQNCLSNLHNIINNYNEQNYRI